MISEFRYYINGMVSQFFLGSTLKMDSERPYVSTYTTLFTLPKIGSQFFFLELMFTNLLLHTSNVRRSFPSVFTFFSKKDIHSLLCM